MTAVAVRGDDEMDSIDIENWNETKIIHKMCWTVHDTEGQQLMA